MGAVWYSNKAVREDRGRKARKTDENIENFRKDLKKGVDKALTMWYSKKAVRESGSEKRRRSLGKSEGNGKALKKVLDKSEKA